MLKNLPFAELEAMYQQRSGILAKAKYEKEKLLEQIKLLDAQINAVEQGSAVPDSPDDVERTAPSPANRVKADRAGRNRPIKNSKTVIQYATEVLREAGEPMTVSALAARIRQKGYKTHSRQDVFQQSVVSQMVREPEIFKRVSMGIYQLA